MSPGHEERDDLEALDPSELDLLAYLDGELEPERAAIVEERLRTDRAYAARLRALEAIGGFLRQDADRIYADAKVDAIVDDVLAKVRASTDKPRLAEVVPLSEATPLTSRAARTRKNTVIWVAFGTVAAAAAAFLVYVNGNDTKPPSPTASASASTQVTVAVVNTAPPPPSHEDPKNTPPVAESAPTVEVENLEVGEGATVIYTKDDDGTGPVVWVTGREGTK